MGTKEGRIYGKGAPFKGAPQRFGGQLPQTAPPWIRHWMWVYIQTTYDMNKCNKRNYQYVKMKQRKKVKATLIAHWEVCAVNKQVA